MFKFLEQKKLRKTATYLLFFGFFAFGLLLFFNGKFDALNISKYNKNNEEVLAAEEKPINCRKQTEVQLPFGVSALFGPNEFEIPTGQVTDKTEDVATRIIQQLSIAIGAAEQENIEAKKIINLAGQCGVSNCGTPGCQTRYSDCEPCLDPITDPENPDIIIGCGQWNKCPSCDKPSCGGQACPDGINSQLQKIDGQKNIISDSSDRIKGILTDWQPNKPVGKWWIPFCSPEFPVIPGCLNERDFILSELKRARDGNYEISLGIVPGCRKECGPGFENCKEKDKKNWECRPPGLEDCVVRPQDVEEFLKGEKTGKFLFSCKEAIIAGIINTGDCYGYRETISESNRAENYYCCE